MIKWKIFLCPIFMLLLHQSPGWSRPQVHQESHTTGPFRKKDLGAMIFNNSLPTHLTSPFRLGEPNHKYWTFLTYSNHLELYPWQVDGHMTWLIKETKDFFFFFLSLWCSDLPSAKFRILQISQTITILIFVKQELLALQMLIVASIQNKLSNI